MNGNTESDNQEAEPDLKEEKKTLEQEIAIENTEQLNEEMKENEEKQNEHEIANSISEANKEVASPHESQENQIQENEEVLEVSPGANSDSDYEEVEIEEPIPPEELEILKAEAEPGVDIPETRLVKKRVKKQSSDEEDFEEAERLEQLKLFQDFVIDKLEEFLDQFAIEMWKPEFIDAFIEFLKEPESSPYNEFAYFLKNFEDTEDINITAQNIQTYLYGGAVKQNHLKGLLTAMNNTFIPIFNSDHSWPENVKKEFMAQLHRFMASLTHVAYQMENFTELYIPNEDLSDLDKVQQDKELIQRLETTLIFWHGQIKDVLNSQDSQNDTENAGPLDEIKYWDSRKTNLSYIYDQLEKSELKKIISILNLVESTYVKGFEDLTNSIKKRSIEAEDNLIFLKSLFEPCKRLRESEPKDIPNLLPSLLNRVRMIWEKSRYYNTPDRISGLLHKISNEIIRICKNKISIKDMLDGDVEKCKQELEDSIDCGTKWKKIYEKMAKLIAKKNRLHRWNFNINSIFAQVDAFVQRCNELIEICEGQIQFARRGADSSLPSFGGHRGPEIIQILEEIKVSFRKNLEKIRKTNPDKILDVKMSTWHDDFNTFKNGMKDLDGMYINIIDYAFESVTTVQNGVELLEAFDYLARRDMIKAAVRKKTKDVIKLFQEELEFTRNEYEGLKKGVPMPIEHGKHSGQGIWVRALIQRIDKMKGSIDKLVFIEEAVKKEAYEKYEQTYQYFRLFITSHKVKDWKEESKDYFDAVLATKLDMVVLERVDESEKQNKLIEQLRCRPGHLRCHFDKGLFKLINETITWKKLSSFGVVIPNSVDDFTMAQRENLRVLREYIMLVVRDYNNNINSLDENEKKLFKEHLFHTDKVIQSGLNRLKWSARGVLDKFVNECRRSCAELASKIFTFKEAIRKIQEKCLEISNRLLIKIDKKRVYDIKSFEEEQERYRGEIKHRLLQYLDEIRKILIETYEDFVFQKPEIQKMWFKYVCQIDEKIEESLKKAVKVSLLELQKIIGDDKITPTPIFKLSVELENGQLGFRPSTEYLIGKIRETTTAMVQILGDLKRMEVHLKKEYKKKKDEAKTAVERERRRSFNPIQPIAIELKIDEEAKKFETFFERIHQDPDVDRHTEKILHNLGKTCDGLGDLLDPWKKREWYWKNTNIKERFARTMVDRKDPVSNLKSQIENFENIQGEIQGQKSTEKHNCIVLDNMNIKNTLVDIMFLWHNAFLSAIQENACAELNNLHTIFQSTTLHLGPTPLDLHQLKKNMDLWKKRVEEKPTIEAQLGPLDEKFKLLYDYSISMRDDDIKKKETLYTAWEDFCAMLDRIEQRNQKVSSDLYYETMKGLENFMRESSDSKAYFQGNAPYSTLTVSNEKAFTILNEYTDVVGGMRKREMEMKFGVDLFSINYNPSPDLEFVENEIRVLEEVWKMKDNWDSTIAKEKKLHFRDFDFERLDDLVYDFSKQLQAFPSESKAWDIITQQKNEFDQFRHTLPLVKMLREPYMRERHWSKLQKYLGTQIFPESDSFNIDTLFQLKLLQYQEAVREVCEIAREEFKIESSLKKIEVRWENFEFTLETHRKAFKLKTTDEIYTALEEDMSSLSAQKTTAFFESFKDPIERWENDLQQILETLEMLVIVQRQWIYLEAIFASQQNEQDKQLIGDINKFQTINSRIVFHMQRIHEEKKVKTALLMENFLKELIEISKEMDRSQKNLNQLLERKRKEFPRFYFLSNDDLFELLGNSKDPYRVNKHIKKCFEGIKRLDIKQIAGGKSKTGDAFEVLSMASPDGEEVLFSSIVSINASVEIWLKDVEKVMRDTLKRQLMKTHSEMKRKDGMRWVEKWVETWPGQLLITASQIHTTESMASSINTVYNNEKQDKKRAWKHCQDEKKAFVEELTRQVRKGGANPVTRLKLVALITVEVHARDIIESLYKTCSSPLSFDFLKQLRFYYNPMGEYYDCFIEQAQAKFPYGFEYQGNNGRLVVTTLTDRCYVTLTNAMFFRKGGAPQGPAGTGKTETVKDLGKGMGKFVLVFNCSEGLDYKSLGKMFSGLIQTGSWGCFDEFNRIDVEVLSVVAQQIHTILDALKNFNYEKPYFIFEDSMIPINENCAIFITMNPTYAGRSELPDNLKSLFRPIAMMIPDSASIAEIILQSEGFHFGKPLALKIVTLYNLMLQQLSKQDHYDFGLRAIKSVLTCAGSIRRSSNESSAKEKLDKESQKDAEHEAFLNELSLLMRAIEDMNLPKFVSNDIPLFNALLTDLFPGMMTPKMENNDLLEGIEREFREQSLSPTPALTGKVIQLFDSMATRHGNMVVGLTLSGKSTSWKILHKTLNKLHKITPAKYPAVRYEVLNPKSVTINELFGNVDPVNSEWNEGVLSSMMSRLCKDEGKDTKWMIIDGPIDTQWIESMNTVLDDNKVLTLLNGDRINLPTNVSLLFEVDSLSKASPATVSRAGMIFLDAAEMTWEIVAQCWVSKFSDETLQEYLFELFERWVPRLLKFKKSSCNEILRITDTRAVMSLCQLLDSFQKKDPMLSFNDPSNKNDLYWALLEKWFTFSVIWSIGATINEESRTLFDNAIRDIESIFPYVGSVYDYYVNNEKNEWASWEDRLGTTWKPNANTPVHKIFVPTSDTVRNRYILQALLREKLLVLSVGVTGTGKTALNSGILSELDETYMSITIVFASQSTAGKTQEFIENKLVRRTKTKVLPDGKKGVIFIDDLNMPKKDKYGTQSALELLRQWIDYEGWFDKAQVELFKQVLDIQFMAAMGPPGGGRNDISERVLSKFYTFGFTFPSESQVLRIFRSILAFNFTEFDEDFKPLAETLAQATYNLYRAISSVFKPTPAKSHYLFNLRDMGKVVFGVCFANRYYVDSRVTIYRLWVHECLRVFNDRLVSSEDNEGMKKLVSDQLELILGTNMKECTNENEEEVVFVDFFDEMSKDVYQEVSYTDRERLTIAIEHILVKFNESNKSTINIVIFTEAVLYLCKISRILKFPRGHGLLIGEGGSGRHSLCKLASFIGGHQNWKIDVHRNYKIKDFHEEVKKWYDEAGFKNRSGVFLFADSDIFSEAFFEDINNILTVGEVPNLFSSKEDIGSIKEKAKKELIRERKLEKDVRVSDEEALEFFFTRVQANIHIMIAMPKRGDTLRTYIRNYPGLVNNTSIIWFGDWPEAALVKVATHHLEPLQLSSEMSESLAQYFGICHTYILEAARRMFVELKRVYTVTPMNYIEVVKAYTQLLVGKRKELGDEIEKLSEGLLKLDQAAINNEELTKQLGLRQIELSSKSKECEDLMIRIESDTLNANESQKEVERRTIILNKEKAEIEILAAEAQSDLDAAEPILKQAEEGLENLKKEQLAELKGYSKPPNEVLVVISVIMTILEKDPAWANAKKELADPGFMFKLKTFEKTKITEKTITKIERYTHRPEMSIENVRNVSFAAAAMWDWVLAMEKFAKTYKDIVPKRKKVNMLKEKLKKSEDELESLRENLIKFKEDILSYNHHLQSLKGEMEQYQEETTRLQNKLEKAEKLLSGLASTKDGWVVRKKKLEVEFEWLTGDSLISASFLSYAGPMSSEYRDAFLNNILLERVKAYKIPHSKNYSFTNFMAKPTDFLKWNFQGLPDDNFSRENGVLVTKNRRFPLMIDPQLQANTWVKNMEREIDKDKIVILDPQSENLIGTIEKAVSFGNVVVLQSLDEDMDPAIKPLLARDLRKVAGKTMMSLGDKEVVFNPGFRLYMMTKLSNPVFPPSISSQVNLVNFSVKERGLEEQLVSIVIQRMEINLEKTRVDLVLKKANNEIKLKQLDDEILRMLQKSEGSLIDNDELIQALQNFKEIEEDLRHQIETSAAAMRKTMSARENYRPLASIGAKIFFIINEFTVLDHMYQFSLENFIILFASNISRFLEKSPSLSDSLSERLKAIGEKFKQEIYRYACRGLFEKDKLLLSLQLAVRLTKDINMSEYNFFLKGNENVIDRKGQPPNPNPDWLSNYQWDQINDLDKMPNFTGIIGAFVHNPNEWKRWFMSGTPESDQLPSEWEQKFDRLRKMILLKIIRADRVLFAATAFVAENIGEFYVNPPNVQIDKLFEDTNKSTPVLFILSPGVDPFLELKEFADSRGKKVMAVSLGQGQAKRAKDKIYEATKAGDWFYLANCHLSVSFMKELVKILELLEINKGDVHNEFRLFLSSNPHDKFPISILQKSIRVTTEPPKGLRANMARIYSRMTEDKFTKFTGDRNKYRKLLFSLAWFHSLLVERKKFKSLGWNIPYDFNDSDFETADKILNLYIEQSVDRGEGKSLQWDAIKYLIAEIVYGGRVTDEWDQRLLNVYTTQYFTEKVIATEEKFYLCDPFYTYYVIPDESQGKEGGNKGHDKGHGGPNPAYYEEKVKGFPVVEPPQAFGQHINAQISSQIADTNSLIESIISLQPFEAGEGTDSIEQIVGKQLVELMEQVPEPFNFEEVYTKIDPEDRNPLKEVLKQEISRYNVLIATVRKSLNDLDDGFKGLIILSEELEEIMHSLFENKVPRSWSFCYHSIKPLRSWIEDLKDRVHQLYEWVFNEQPKVFWISGFSFPTGFTTALLQLSARRLSMSIDSLGWEFSFLPRDSHIPAAARDGAYVTGLFLEGARWDHDKNYLIDAEAMKLYSEMPIVHFKPLILEGKSKQKKGQPLYPCPCYMYPIRSGGSRPSFQFTVNLPCKPNAAGIVELDFWIKRGTALLMSLGR